MFVVFRLALLLPRFILGFGGEDPVKGHPFYHEKLTRDGAKEAGGWDAGTIGEHPTVQAVDVAAAEDEAVRGTDDPEASATSSLAWHADYVDSYLYNMMWNAGGGVGRLKAALFARDELVKVHFDDLTSTEQISVMWNRYLGGTVAGLLWAAERGDVPAARHIVGVGLHAAQDFYSHSNWLDDPDRRGASWFDFTPEQREAMFLYTGTYELGEQHGFKHHSKIAFDCKLMHEINDVLGLDTMDLICSGFSPLSDTGLCRRWRECRQNSVPAHPDTIAGVKMPDGIIYLGPPGIALDSVWQSQINVVNRDLPELAGGGPVDNKKLGSKLFEHAQASAGRHTAQWLQQLHAIMTKAGHQAFWTEVRTRPRSGEIVDPGLPILSDFLRAYAEDTRQFEQPNKLPSTFLSAGAYPPAAAGTDEGWFVRLQLRTADDEFGTGTNSDVDVTIGGKTFRLDHGHDVNRLLEFNDFESGDDTFYVVGPLPFKPAEMTLHNRGTTVFDIIEAAWEDLKDFVDDALDKIATFLLSLIGGNADYVGSDKMTWTWEELEAIADQPTETEFRWKVDGGGEGKHEVIGRILTVRRPNGSLKAKVRMRFLKTIEESDIDEPSDDPTDDEVMVMMLVNSPAAGQLVAFRTSPIDNVDSDETHDIFMDHIEVDIPRHGGLIAPIQVWESDLEGEGKRNEMLRNFRAQYDDRTEPPRSAFLDAVGAAVLPDWKLAGFDAFAYRRGAVVQTATLAQNRQVNRWIEAGRSLNLPFDRTPIRATPVPALNPATTSTVVMADGSVGGVAVGPDGVVAVGSSTTGGVAGRLVRTGLFLEAGPSRPTEPAARSVAYDAELNRVYAVTHNQGIQMFDATTLNPLGTANLGFGVVDVALDSEKGRLYVSRSRVTGGHVLVLSTADLSVLHEHTDPSGFHGPLGMAVDNGSRRLHVARSFRSGGPTGPMVTAHTVFDLRADGSLGHVVTLTFDPPNIQPMDVAIDEPAGLVFLAGLGANTPGAQPRVIVVDRVTLNVKGHVILPSPARAIATRPGSGIAYVVGEAGLMLVDGRLQAHVMTVPLGHQPHAVAVDPATGASYVGDRIDGTLTRVDAPTGLT